MTSANIRVATPEISREDAASMARYEITRVPSESFHYREFRYANLKDALAQAKRDEQRSA